ncbi:MAG: hypothetical protein E5W25_23520, partial [Mesorhizobium sp.]
VGLVLLFVALVAWLFNAAADPNEQWFSTPHVFLYVGGFGAAVLLYFQAVRPATRLQQSFRDTVLPMIFGFVRDVRYQHGVRPNSFDRLPRETIGAFNRQSFDDIISGRYEDFPFELYEAKLTEGCGVPELDASYEFRTDNVEAARPLVTGRLASALTWLGETWPYDQARIALNGSDGFLLMPRSKNFFELPDISVLIDYQTHIAPMIADLGAMLATAALVRKIGAADDAAG